MKGRREVAEYTGYEGISYDSARWDVKRETQRIFAEVQNRTTRAVREVPRRW
jgi:hypothetical protein